MTGAATTGEEWDGGDTGASDRGRSLESSEREQMETSEGCLCGG